MVASWGCQRHIWCWGQLYLAVLLAATSFSILGKQGCVAGVSAAYSALGAARIVGSIFARLSAATSFSILGKQGCVLAAYLALGAAVGGNLFLHFGKAGLCCGGDGGVFGVGGSIVGSKRICRRCWRQLLSPFLLGKTVQKPSPNVSSPQWTSRMTVSTNL